jgi:putative NADH-flavin reductase
MNIAIFGASGATGTLLTGRCLDAGHRVTTLLRTPDKFSLRDRIRVIHGNAFDSSAVHQTGEGADVVLSALGASSPFKKEDVLERAVPPIIAAMQQTGVRRIIVLGASGALPHALDKQPAWRRWLFRNIVNKTLLKWPLASQVSQ